MYVHASYRNHVIFKYCVLMHEDLYNVQTKLLHCSFITTDVTVSCLNYVGRPNYVHRYVHMHVHVYVVQKVTITYKVLTEVVC